MSIPKSETKVKISVVIAIALVSGSFLPLFQTQATVDNTVSLKAVLLSVDSIYTQPYGTQSAQNLLRDWGVPFDNFSISSITPSTFWNSVSQENNYQFIVVAGSSSLDGEGTYSSVALNAIIAAVHNGTSILILGSAISQLGSLLGYSSYVECPVHAQTGGYCSGETSLKVNINSTFTGPKSGDKTWLSGTSFVASGVPNIATLSTQPRIAIGTKVFVSYSVNSTQYPLVSFKKIGTSMVWYLGGIQGAYTDYLTGWSYMFQSILPGNGDTLFRPVEDLFEYALSNMTIPSTPHMLSWGQYGSAEVIRILDHESLTSAACNQSGSPAQLMVSAGLAGEINFNLNGISNSMLQTVSSSKPSNVINSRGVSGFRYFGTIGGGATGTNNQFELTAIVDNMTYIVNDGNFTQIKSSHSITFPITDGNTTIINRLAVLVSTSSSVAWQLSFSDQKGSVLWSSPVQSSSFSSPSWVNFKNVNFTDSSSGYLNNIQGNNKLTLKVTSGSVNWVNSTSTHASVIVTGRSNWDSVYLNVEGTGNFVNDLAIVPDSIVMANGQLYPSQNKTIHFSSIPGEVHPADIVGESNTGAPIGVNFETFFTLQDWQSKQGQTVLQSCLSYAQKYHTTLMPNGWTHAKSVVGSYDNDGYLGNNTDASNAFKIQRYNDIVSYFNKLLGNKTGTVLSLYSTPSWSAEWAFGTSSNSVEPLLPELSHGGIFDVFQVSDGQNGEVYGGFNRQSPVTTSCTQTTCGSYTGNIYTAPNRDGGKVNNLVWAIGFNVSRSLGGIVETPSDWNYITSDYLLAQSQGWTQPYSTASTVFTTNYAAVKFYLATLYMLTHTKSFQWNSVTNTITLTSDTSTPTFVNASSWGLPIVFQLPASFQGRSFISASDTRSAGSVSHSTVSSEYYQINVGRGLTTMTFTYDPVSTSTSLSSSSSSYSTSSSTSLSSSSTSKTSSSSTLISSSSTSKSSSSTSSSSISSSSISSTSSSSTSTSSSTTSSSSSSTTSSSTSVTSSSSSSISSSSTTSTLSSSTSTTTITSTQSSSSIIVSGPIQQMTVSYYQNNYVVIQVQVAGILYFGTATTMSSSSWSNAMKTVKLGSGAIGTVITITVNGVSISSWS